MLRSSLGFHTLTLFLRLTREEIQRLIKHFYKYCKETGLIRMRMLDIIPRNQKLHKVWREYAPKYSGTSLLVPSQLRISYAEADRDQGIKWTIRCDRQRETHMEYVVRATINPKLLGGIHDYLTAATCDDMEVAILNFNRISQSISPVLGTFEQYTLQRIDYCINFALDELVPECTYEQMINLIKRSDIPYHYTEWTEYDTISHRAKSKPGSFYLTNDSVHINCYSKYMQLQEQTRENMEKGYPPIPQKTMDAAHDIIRFEVQCKYRNVYARSRRVRANENSDVNLYKDLLSHEVCAEVINYYFNKIVGKGHWYSLQAAISTIKLHDFNRQKKDRLIDTLRFVSQCRSLAKAKATYQGGDLAAFKRSLKDLTDMGINPVTIPREWGVGRIWNLLETYHNKVAMERINKQVEEELLQDKKLIKWVIAHA